MLLEIPARYPLSKPVNILIIPFLSKERSFPRWDIAHIIVSDLDWFGRGFGSWSAILLIVTNLPACINSEIEMKSCPASKTQNRWDRKGKSFPHFLTVCLLLKWMLPPKGKDRGESKQIYPSKNPPKLFAYWIPHLLPTISPFDRFLEQFSNPPPPTETTPFLSWLLSGVSPTRLVRVKIFQLISLPIGRSTAQFNPFCFFLLNLGLFFTPSSLYWFWGRS